MSTELAQRLMRVGAGHRLRFSASATMKILEAEPSDTLAYFIAWDEADGWIIQWNTMKSVANMFNCTNDHDLLIVMSGVSMLAQDEGGISAMFLLMGK